MQSIFNPTHARDEDGRFDLWAFVLEHEQLYTDERILALLWAHYEEEEERLTKEIARLEELLQARRAGRARGDLCERQDGP
jgi:hypothetical protein